MCGHVKERRAGATLVEVLVAIFVMALGLMALLTLFPLGALRMAQAIQDDRATHTAHNAIARARIWDVGLDPDIAPAFNNPNPPGLPPVARLPHPDGPSFPVFVDPTGWFTSGGSPWLAGVAGSIPRRNTARIGNNAALALNLFSLLDDIVFNQDGQVQPQTFIGNPPVPVFDRDIRYSFALMCQRPRASEPVVQVSVVVYNRRPLTLNGNGTLNELPFVAEFDAASGNRITVRVPAGSLLPPVRVGDWLLDATPVVTLVNNAPAFETRHGAFYRVVSVNEIDALTTEYEVHQPLRGFKQRERGPGTFIQEVVAGSDNYQGVVIVLEGVAEVYEKGAIR